MKINQDMINDNYISYNNLDKFKCDENPELLNLEKKLDPFSLDVNYNYATNLCSNKNQLPDINLDLSKIAQHYKNPHLS